MRRLIPAGYILSLDVLACLLLYLATKHKAAALFLFLLLLVNAAVYQLMTMDREDAPSEGNKVESRLSQRELGNSIKILRYAAAALAALSWITTAEGLKSFAFPQAYQAYLASFAIQAILLVFSFMLCHFCVQLHTVRTLSRRSRRLLIYVLVSFFTIALLFSSTFSYVFIVNTIYRPVRSRDDNVIIERYLTKAAGQLRAENERQGRAARESLAAGLDSLNQIYEGENLLARTEYEDFLASQLPEEYEGGLTGRLTEEAKVEILRSNHGKMPAELDQLCGVIFDSYEAYDRFLEEYHEVYRRIPSSPEQATVEELNSARRRIERLSQSVAQSMETIKGLRGTVYVNDLTPYKAPVLTAYDGLALALDSLEDAAASLERILETGALAPGSGRDAKITPKALAAMIYTEEVEEQEVAAFQKSAAGLMGELAGQEEIDPKRLAGLAGLESGLADFARYVRLKTELDAFLHEDLSHVLVIGSEDPEAARGGKSSRITYVSEQEWRAIRKDQFHTFYRLLKLLPEGEVADGGAYSANEVLSEAYALERDLLENIRDFERAINYFKYDFHTMAYFSVLIALFLDLGSFLTGCFMFTARYFAEKPQDSVGAVYNRELFEHE